MDDDLIVWEPLIKMLQRSCFSHRREMSVIPKSAWAQAIVFRDKKI